jgi:hypothetical protein
MPENPIVGFKPFANDQTGRELVGWPKMAGIMFIHRKRLIARRAFVQNCVGAMEL